MRSLLILSLTSTIFYSCSNMKSSPPTALKIEKKLESIDKKLDRHIKDIWEVYEPIKKILEKLERFKLW